MQKLFFAGMTLQTPVIESIQSSRDFATRGLFVD